MNKSNLKMKYKLIFIIPAVIWSALIFIFSNQSQPPFFDLGFQWNDKLLHMLAYFAYGLTLIFFLFGSFENLKIKNAIIYLLIFGAIFGITDEIHQSLIPGRDAEVFDWIADCIGISLSLSLLTPLNKFITKLKFNFINNSN
ncbi:MAG: VanZ family protein [Ignavibacteriae bacterium]|nr:VanZ family protein [Ignavibacteriota bacterium]